VVAVTNDFSWVQFSTINHPPKKSNPQPPSVEVVQVTWRSGHRLPEKLHGRPPRVLEVVTGTPLEVHQVTGGYRIDLPAFQFMALLVVAEPGPSPGQRHAA
jgi:hypothetical protein